MKTVKIQELLTDYKGRLATLEERIEKNQYAPSDIMERNVYRRVIGDLELVVETSLKN